MRLLIIFISAVVLFAVSCKKDKSPDKYCWQLLDHSGNKLNQICDKTEAELIDCVEHNTCGTFNFSSTLTDCNYYKIDQTLFCWVSSDVNICNSVQKMKLA